MYKKVNVFLTLVACFAVFCNVENSFAQDKYPSKAIEMIIPWAPGGPADIGGRIFINEMGKIVTVPLTPINKDGATGTIGAVYVHKARKDGYTLLIGSASWYQASLVLEGIPYDLTKDFVPIALISTTPHGLFVNSNSSYRTLEDLIAGAKKNPRAVSCGSAGTASGGHFNLEILQQAANAQIKHVPFKGNAEIPPAVLGGHIDFGIGAITGALPLVNAGKLKFLAVTGSKRSALLPEIPTFRERGFPQHFLENWVGLFVSAGVPKNVVDTLTAESAKVVKSREFIEKIEKSGSDIEYLVRSDFEKHLANEKNAIEAVARSLKIKKDGKK